jgi:hypothetical protein
MDAQDEKADLGKVLLEMETPQAEEPRTTAKIVAGIIWLITNYFFVTSPLTEATAGSYSAGSEIFWISTLGFIIVLFANRRLANFTGLRPFVSLIPLDKPSPIVAVRFVGWAFLLVGLAVFLFVLL